MLNAIEEMRIQRDLERLEPFSRAAILLSCLKPHTRECMYARLSSTEIGRLLWEIGLLTAVSPGVRRRILTEFCERLRVRRGVRKHGTPSGEARPAL